MNPNQPFQPSTPPPAQFTQQAPIDSSLLPHKPSKMPLIAAILFALLFIGATIFAFWAFAERETYKNDADVLAQQKVDAALQVQKEELSQEFAEQAKSPFLTFRGPSTYGSFKFDYPRTWSVYVEESNSGSLYTIHMHPNQIEDVDDRENLQAFVMEVVGSDYESQISRVVSLEKQGKVTSSTYRLPLVDSVLGLRVKGEYENKINGQRIYLPIRDRTLLISTESGDFTSDFDKILSTLTFTP